MEVSKYDVTSSRASRDGNISSLPEAVLVGVGVAPSEPGEGKAGKRKGGVNGPDAAAVEGDETIR